MPFWLILFAAAIFFLSSRFAFLSAFSISPTSSVIEESAFAADLRFGPSRFMLIDGLMIASNDFAISIS